MDELTIKLTRGEIERLIKVIQYQAELADIDRSILDKLIDCKWKKDD